VNKGGELRVCEGEELGVVFFEPGEELSFNPFHFMGMKIVKIFFGIVVETTDVDFDGPIVDKAKVTDKMRVLIAIPFLSSFKGEGEEGSEGFFSFIYFPFFF
jgi:hypothetical protein